MYVVAGGSRARARAVSRVTLRLSSKRSALSSGIACPLLTPCPQVSPTQVIQAHTVMQSLVQEFGNKPVLMIGGPENVPGASRTVMEGCVRRR